MRLTVTTPLAVVVDTEDVAHLRAEDETGAFGILPHHDNFLTVLTVSVMTWRDGNGTEHHVALRGGMLEVRDGTTVVVATREAVPGDDLLRLESEVLTVFREQENKEQAAHADAERLYLAAIRQILDLLRPQRRTTPRAPDAADRLASPDQ
ncbi:MAG TPA: F0F1 ATP synthase subunit epsilon [Gammaproteobacteria bacterium]|nr:F0F1 ATP synthase subunit epsilon [Gammaproteobacteria bacterium]